MPRQLETAVRLTLAAQLRNRLAWILLLAFIPVWYLVIGSMLGHGGVKFLLRATGAYASIVMLAFWRPSGLWAIAVAFMLGAATYAAFGLLMGVLVRGDLEGFFLIIMISMLDTFLENPVDNPLGNKPILEFFPSYGATQFGAAGAFRHQVVPSMVAVLLAWTAAFALLGLLVLRLRLPRRVGVAAPVRGVSAETPRRTDARPARS